MSRLSITTALHPSAPHGPNRRAFTVLPYSSQADYPTLAIQAHAKTRQIDWPTPYRSHHPSSYRPTQPCLIPNKTYRLPKSYRISPRHTDDSIRATSIRTGSIPIDQPTHTSTSRNAPSRNDYPIQVRSLLFTSTLLVLPCLDDYPSPHLPEQAHPRRLLLPCHSHDDYPTLPYSAPTDSPNLAISMRLILPHLPRSLHPKAGRLLLPCHSHADCTYLLQPPHYPPTTHITSAPISPYLIDTSPQAIPHRPTTNPTCLATPCLDDYTGRPASTRTTPLPTGLALPTHPWTTTRVTTPRYVPHQRDKTHLAVAHQRDMSSQAMPYLASPKRQASSSPHGPSHISPSRRRRVTSLLLLPAPIRSSRQCVTHHTFPRRLHVHNRDY